MSPEFPKRLKYRKPGFRESSTLEAQFPGTPLLGSSVNTPPWGLNWSWIATTWRSGRRSLASLLASNAAPRVPGLDHDVLGWLSEANDDELGYVGAEEVRGSPGDVSAPMTAALRSGSVTSSTRPASLASPFQSGGPPIRYVARSGGRAGGRAPSPTATCSPATAPRRRNRLRCR